MQPILVLVSDSSMAGTVSLALTANDRSRLINVLEVGTLDARNGHIAAIQTVEISSPAPTFVWASHLGMAGQFGSE